MPTPKKGARLGGSAKQQAHMLSNLAASLIEHPEDFYPSTGVK